MLAAVPSLRLFIHCFRMKQESTLTALTVTIGLLAVYLFTGNERLVQVVFILGVLLVLFSWVRERLHDFWMFLTKILGYVMPNILLSLIFYLVVTPLGLFTRLIKVKSQLMLKDDNESFFVKTGATITKKSFQNPW